MPDICCDIVLETAMGTVTEYLRKYATMHFAVKISFTIKHDMDEAMNGHAL